MTDIPSLKRLERKAHGLILTWSNGSEFNLNYNELRYWCPCAKCSPRRNDEENQSLFRKEVQKTPHNQPNVKKVGGYALQFEWDLGCSSGIFRFERLWDIVQSINPDGGRPFVHGAW